MSSRPVSTLREAALPQSGVVQAAAVVAGALLVAAAAQMRIPLPFTPVPITLQTFAVFLVGGSLGAVSGGLSLGLYLAAGIAGLPFFSGGKGGLDAALGATGGYLLGFVAAALVVGYLAEKGWDRKFATSIAAMVLGSIPVYLFGVPWLASSLDVGIARAAEMGLYPYLLGDAVKIVLAGAALPAGWKLIKEGRSKRS